MKYYTGIGSRDIPLEYGKRMFETCERLSNLGYILRSGGADGSDTQAEMGQGVGNSGKEIYLPFKNFNDRFTGIPLEDLDPGLVKKAELYVSEVHPNWEAVCRRNLVKKLHTRNIFQLLGRDLTIPSDFVLCYTDDGTPKGGTATVMNLAKKMGIPVYNLYYDNVEKFIEFL